MKYLLPAAIMLLGILWQPAESQERNWSATFTGSTGDVINQETPSVQYQWPADIPPGMTEQFYLEAEATVTALSGDGVYGLRVSGTDQARVYVDGQRVIDAWVTGASRESQVEMQVTTGYQVYLESRHVGSTETALLWMPPGETEWTPIPARDEDTADWCDVTLSWLAPTVRTDGTALAESEIAKFTMYRGACGTSEMTFLADIDPSLRSVGKSQAVPPGVCYAYKITVTDMDGLESTHDTTERDCPQAVNAPPSKPVFTN